VGISENQMKILLVSISRAHRWSCFDNLCLNSVIVMSKCLIFFYSFGARGYAPEDTCKLLPMNDRLLYGTLKNGVTCFVDNDLSRGNWVEIRFVVKVGSRDENDDQLQYAHLIEHLMFESVQLGDSISLRRYLIGEGLSMGVNANASTVTQHTTYEFKLPSDRVDVISGVLRRLSNFQYYPGFASRDIEAQTGAILSEFGWGGRGEHVSSRQQIDEKVLGHSCFGFAGLRKGVMSLSKVDTTKLHTFFTKWYRASLMSVIVVGDIHRESMIEILERTFDSCVVLSAFEDFSSEIVRTVKFKSGRSKIIPIIDSKLLYPIVEVYYRRSNKFPVVRTSCDLRDRIVESFALEVFNNRFENAPGERRYASTIISNMQGSGIDVLKVHTLEGKFNIVDTAILDIMKALNEISNGQILSCELEEVRQMFLEDSGKVDGESSRQIADRYVEIFVYGGGLPSKTYENRQVSEIIASLTLSDISGFFDGWVQDRLLGAVFAVCKSSECYSDVFCNRVIKDFSLRKKFSSLNPSCVDDSLDYFVETLRSEGSKVLINEQWKVRGVRRLVLSNGVNVFVQVGDSVNDGEFHFAAYRSGGSLAIPCSQRLIANNFGQFIGNCGIGPFNAELTYNIFRKRGIYISPFITPDYSVIRGRSRPTKIEDVMKLLLVFMSNVGRNYSDCKECCMRTRDEILRVGRGNVSRNIIDDLSSYRSAAFECLDTGTYWHVGEDFDMVRDFFTRAPDDFVFFLTGRFDLEDVFLLISKYLGSIPKTELSGNEFLADSVVEDWSRPYTNIREIYFEDVKRARAYMSIRPFHANENTLVNHIVFSTIANMIGSRVFERLRTKEGLSYYPVVNLSNRRISRDSILFRIDISFDISSEKAHRGMDIVKEEIGIILSEPMAVSEFRASIESVRIRFHEDFAPPFSLEDLVSAYHWDDCLDYEEGIDDAVDKVSVEDVYIGLRRLFQFGDTRELLVLPKNSQ
jgi:zinc protease